MGRPGHFAYVGDTGVEVVEPNTPVAGERMQECWVLAWFAGAQGCGDFDVPWLIALQRRPESIEINNAGLEFRFAGECGYAAAMPLYGYYKPPAQGKDKLAEAGLESKGIETWKWKEGIPEDVAERCRWWASTTRMFATYCKETFSVDPAKDRITVKQDYTWLAIEDDWKTKPRRFALIPHTLALANLYGTFPVTFDTELHDPWYVTSYGPCVGAIDKDSVSYSMDVLQYVHETEAQAEPDMNSPCVRAAVEKLQSAMRAKFKASDGSYTFDHGENNFVWASMSDCWYPKALKYMDAETRENALKSLRNYYHNAYLESVRYRVDSGYPHPYYVAYGPGCWDGKLVKTDSGKLATARLYTLWCYAHYTGDWDLIKDKWEIVRYLHSTEQTMVWKTMGRGSIAELGDEAPPSMALARLAYRTGDVDTYLYGCYLFARELVHHYVKQMGADYFRRNQPYHSLEIMPEHVYLTNLWGDTAGWQIDGPTFPQRTGERQYTNRWVRFQSEDVARFHRDTMSKWLKDELDYYLDNRSRHYELARDTAHIGPSQIRLRSFLLDESPEELFALAGAEKWEGHAAGCGTAAITMAVIRTSKPAQYERLIPGGPAYPLVTGLERDIASRDGGTTIDRNTRPAENRWPKYRWIIWKSPKQPENAHGQGEFGFGYITPDPENAPTAAAQTSWNWVTSVTAYDVPQQRQAK